jgi:protein-S-isoprenylcysteine O-methyltransferase Ste14
MSLIGGWTNLIYKVATGGWKAKVFFGPFLAASFAGLIVGLLLLSRIADRWLGLPGAFNFSGSLVIGFLLMAFGLAIYGLSVFQFLRVRGTPVPFIPPPTLVRTGLYRFSRNPMMTGLFMQFFGLGIALGSFSLTFFFTPLFIAMNVWELKMVEEPELERRLGEAYVKYKKEVPMFFPFRKGPGSDEGNTGQQS